MPAPSFRTDTDKTLYRCDLEKRPILKSLRNVRSHRVTVAVPFARSTECRAGSAGSANSFIEEDNSLGRSREDRHGTISFIFKPECLRGCIKAEA